MIGEGSARKRKGSAPPLSRFFLVFLRLPWGAVNFVISRRHRARSTPPLASPLLSTPASSRSVSNGKILVRLIRLLLVFQRRARAIPSSERKAMYRAVFFLLALLFPPSLILVSIPHFRCASDATVPRRHQRGEMKRGKNNYQRRSGKLNSHSTYYIVL